MDSPIPCLFSHKRGPAPLGDTVAIVRLIPRFRSRCVPERPLPWIGIAAVLLLTLLGLSLVNFHQSPPGVHAVGDVDGIPNGIPSTSPNLLHLWAHEY